MKSRNELTLNEATITIEEVNTFLGFAGIVPRESITGCYEQSEAPGDAQ